MWEKKKSAVSKLAVLMLVSLFLLLLILGGILLRNIFIKEPVQPDRAVKAGKDITSTKEQEKVEVVEVMEVIIDSMSLEEKIGQLFIITPEALTGYSTVTAAGQVTKDALVKYPVGGLIYFSKNLTEPEQVRKMLEKTRKYAGEVEKVPLFLSIDEEGGQVARIGGNPAFDVPRLSNMSTVSDKKKAKEVGSQIGNYLSGYGFNLDFAPVADVLSNPENTVVQERSFGNNPEQVSSLATEVREGLEEHGILSVYKHFPGHGGTAGDTHEGFAYTNKTYEELKECEWIPFMDGIAQGVPFIMAGHISAPKVTGGDTPGSLSKIMVTDILRKDLKYKGIVITDALNMGAITKKYSSGESAVKAIGAGVDILLMPDNFKEAFEAVVQAVKEGRISEERLSESLERILKIKMGMPG